jgi:ABC-2 type transport system ATP-binding protein
MRAPSNAIVVERLGKRYGKTRALDGLDLTVATGTVCGLLGPNGAGKTTLVRILSTLLHFDNGRAAVAGFDVSRQAAQVRHQIGLAGQQAAVDEILTGRQNLTMFGRLSHLDGRAARRRADELLDQFGLSEAADQRARHYSGGMRRRLDLAVSLILAPSVLFLDEPTTGLDPRSRTQLWGAIRALVSAGTTVLLTTQYLDEADQLAHQIAVIDRGRVIADGTPEHLKSRIGGNHIEVVVRCVDELPAVAAIIRHVASAEPEIHHDARRVSAPIQDRVAALTGVVRALAEERIAAEDITLRRPTLDDVFLQLTGHRAQASTKEAA